MSYINLEDPLTMQALESARNIEEYFDQGRYVDLEKTLLLKARIDDDTGLWRVVLISPQGKVHYSACDHNFSQIRIETFPSAEFIKEHTSLSMEEAKRGSLRHSRSFTVDLSQPASLRSAKNFFADDFVLKNIRIISPEGLRTAIDLMTIHLRDYRRDFIQYQRQFSFLWKNSPFQNARSLAGAIRSEKH